VLWLVGLNFSPHTCARVLVPVRVYARAYEFGRSVGVGPSLSDGRMDGHTRRK